MTRARFIYVARCCLMALGALVVAWLCPPLRLPALLLVPVALFMPVFPATTTGSLYWTEIGGHQMKRSQVVSATDFTPSGTTAYIGSTDNTAFCFDRKNLQFYQGSSTAIITWAENNFASTSTFSTPGHTINAIDCDPTNTRLFYITVNGSTKDLRTVNYDGSGDVSLITWTAGATPCALCYDLTSDSIYYSRSATGFGQPAEIHKVLADGTGDTTIRTRTSATSTLLIPAIAIDFVGRKLFWHEASAVVAGTAPGIWAGAMDATGAAKIFSTGSLVTFAGLVFSQLLTKLYVWDNTINAIKQMNGDGTGATTVYTLPGSYTNANNGFALGDVLETLGSGAIFS